MNEWPIGISTGLFYQKNFFDCIREIEGYGFSIIEISSSKTHLDYHSKQDVEKASKLIEKLQLEPYSFHAPFGPDIDITSSDHNRRQQAKHEIFSAIEAAAILNAKNFVFHPGPEKAFEPPLEQRLQRMNNATKMLDEIHNKCSQLGVNLLLENMLPHLFSGKTNEMLWIIGSMQALQIGTCLDTGHAFLGNSLKQMIYKLSACLRLIHISDNAGQGDDHIPPPQGHIDWPQFIADLKATNYNGVLMLELSPSQDRLDKELKRACSARHYLRSIMKF